MDGIEEAKLLQREKDDAEKQDAEEAIPCVFAHAQSGNGWLQVFGRFAGNERGQQIGLHEGEQGERGGRDARRIGKRVEQQSHAESPQQQSPAWIVATDADDEIDIE